MPAPGSAGSNSPAGAVNGWCSESQRRSSSFALHQRPVDDPDEARRASSGSGRSARPRSSRSCPSTASVTGRSSATSSSRSPSSAPSRSLSVGQLCRGEELGGGRAPAVALAERPDQPFGAQLLGARDEAVELGARHLAAAGVEPAHRSRPPPSTERKTLNSVSREDVAEVDQLQSEAQVGPVGAEAVHRLGVRHARASAAATSGPPTALEHVGKEAFVELDHVVAVDEGHLDVELGELRLAVGPGRLVAEAAGDLVIALEAGDHQQLLEQLRRLRQRVEGALLQAAGDEEVAGALRGRAGQDRASRRRRKPSPSRNSRIAAVTRWRSISASRICSRRRSR